MMHRQKLDFRRVHGFSVLELVVVLGILSILISLLLPAVQAAREAARKAMCQSNLKQQGIAVSAFESSFSELPSGGWGYAWVADSSRGYGQKQPGGWIFQILPQLEATALSDAMNAQAAPGQARVEALQESVPAMRCPSRQRQHPSVYLGQIALRNIDAPRLAFRGDYAACGGHIALANDPGPDDDRWATLRDFRSPHTGRATGVIYQLSQTKLSEITDGLSNTYLIGEKYVRLPAPTNVQDRDRGDDQAALIGDDHDIRRWTADPPRGDRDLDSPDAFGSRHISVWGVSLCDGSVKMLSFRMDQEIHRQMANRANGAERPR